MSEGQVGEPLVSGTQQIQGFLVDSLLIPFYKDCSFLQLAPRLIQ